MIDRYEEALAKFLFWWALGALLILFLWPKVEGEVFATPAITISLCFLVSGLVLYGYQWYLYGSYWVIRRGRKERRRRVKEERERALRD